MGDHPEDNTMQLLESIANGQQQLTQVLTHLFSNNQANQNQGGTNGNHAEVIHRCGMNLEQSNTYVPTHSVFQEGSKKVPIPLFPPFLEEQPTGAQKQHGMDEMNSYFRDYQLLEKGA
jgi:hypothetical protein